MMMQGFERLWYDDSARPDRQWKQNTQTTQPTSNNGQQTERSGRGGEPLSSNFTEILKNFTLPHTTPWNDVVVVVVVWMTTTARRAQVSPTEEEEYYSIAEADILPAAAAAAASKPRFPTPRAPGHRQLPAPPLFAVSLQYCRYANSVVQYSIV